ncbi:type I restriction enzyme HsdR N-terminal domain-containing protein [Thiocapsa rosea]|uniref:Type I restriction and modification enzyme subunit R-like protein n=1 Tax=Thiocapsa rosea TaxID=69360 RepID=A0A495V381_9GAMM|nr:type I restriction enzyme HsdR N-terminal domain-containing protein [Thiocapsa rosea]RKT42817.1 type I restriction and modification enzyme subunit R-like protein [Thiocapsa rosea]
MLRTRQASLQRRGGRAAALHRILVEHYGYSLDQLDQARRTQHGHKNRRADIVIWESAADKAANRVPVMVVECTTDSIEIQERDYYFRAAPLACLRSGLKSCTTFRPNPVTGEILSHDREAPTPEESGSCCGSDREGD